MDNTFKIPRKQWKKWSKISQTVFENLFTVMNNNGHLFRHPKTYEISGEEWKTTCWNAAWMAADFTQAELNRIKKEL